MTWIDLGNPIPRDLPKKQDPFCWPKGEIEYLTNPTSFPVNSFFEVISSRRSRRIFGQVDSNTLATLLWLTCREQARGNSNFGFPLTKRPTPSAGAIHPIHILVNKHQDSGWVRYIADKHALAEIPSDMISSAEIRVALQNVLSPQHGTLILFVAEPAKTFAKYDHGCSLVWRDAGVLLGHIGLAAEALGLNFCPLGITGEPWANQLDQQGSLVGVGMALLGSTR